MRTFALASGASRLVLLVGPLAFKLPHPGAWRRFLRGLLANMQEAAWSRTGDVRLCPVRLAVPGGFLVVMVRAEPFASWGEAEVAACNELASERPWRCQVPAEIKHSSWGWIGDRLVAVDYGS